ncbi:transcriptional regulator, AlpA family [Methylobacillus rhizosphaerae]|uniref:Transcriptional regulator, AlpA family n=1 Tax=Methylobacillus rhizosphaerae TaxID=551994 RepID=A0A238YTV2_9PROT|nr:AlpA family phage regulatory protein [Methylobacillus rhizosphaerae]SNR74101.1 transcriptional regulator, AlpA family [Methylobacillus rhizosphaerae]
MLQNTLPNTGFVRLPQILSVIPVGKSTWWSGVKAGKYPAPIKLGANTTVWKAEDIHDLIAKLAAEGASK